MYSLRDFALPLRSACALAPVLLLAAASVAGCATSQARSFEPPARVSASPPYVAGPNGAGVEMEDDGVPVQSPPVTSRNGEPDDPSEPFSRNYGRPLDDLTQPDRAEAKPAAAPRRSYVAITR